MTDDRSVLSRPARPPDLTWPYGDRPDQVVEVYTASPGDGPGLVLVHGGYWRPEYDRMHLRPMASALADAGWTTYLIEYRREPGQPTAATDDVRAAAAACAAAHGAAGVIIIGHSAGGHLALHAASEALPGVKAVIALAPVADLEAALAQDLDAGAARAFLGDVPHADMCPITRPAPRVPVTILHGDEDDLVPLGLARTYATTHPNTMLIELPGIGHFGLIDPRSAAWSIVLGAVRAAGS
jgi:acetyl esterase/lipase